MAKDQAETSRRNAGLENTTSFGVAAAKAKEEAKKRSGRVHSSWVLGVFGFFFLLFFFYLTIQGRQWYEQSRQQTGNAYWGGGACPSNSGHRMELSRPYYHIGFYFKVSLLKKSLYSITTPSLVVLQKRLALALFLFFSTLCVFLMFSHGVDLLCFINFPILLLTSRYFPAVA